MVKKDIVAKKKGEIIHEARINEELKEKNKRKLFVLLGLALLVALAVGSLIWYVTREEEVVDSKKFKEEYEILNDQKNSNQQNYVKVTIPSDNPIKYSSYDEIFKILEDGTGVIYFGFPECPWCRNLVPVLIEALEETGLETLYYLNNLQDRDKKSLDRDQKIVIDKEGTKEYYELVEKLSSVLGNYEGVDEDSKRLYFPTVIFVKDGQIVDFHEGTLDSQTDASILLTEEEQQELKNKLIEKINKVLVCDSAC